MDRKEGEGRGTARKIYVKGGEKDSVCLTNEKTRKRTANPRRLS